MKIYKLQQTKEGMKLPLYISHISAGFPSPADDFIERKIDLNKELIKNPASTFLVEVDGDSMIDIGIGPRDLLVVDRSLGTKNRSIVVVTIGGEFLVKRYV